MLQFQSSDFMLSFLFVDYSLYFSICWFYCDIIWLIFIFFQVYLWLIFFSLPLSFVWSISCLAETNHTTFDFAEGESELVSVFNVEYGAGGFALIFLVEYA